MSWATHYIAKLQVGETVEFRPRGNSMTPRINSGNLCKVRPLIEDEILESGMTVLCRVSGSQYLHIIKAVQEDRIQIGNNHGKINGWTNRKNIFGILIGVSA
jgi:hypothetical protein